MLFSLTQRVKEHVALIFVLELLLNPEEAYEELLFRMREIDILGHTAGVLGWDQEVYMPAANAAYRAEQLALLVGQCHQKFIDPKTGDLISQAESSKALTGDRLSDSAVNLREWRRSYDRNRKLPQKLVEELARVTSNAQVEWVEARQENNYPRFQPWLEKIIALVREEAECYGYEDHPYDALLEDYEPGLTTAQLDKLLPALREKLTELSSKIASSPHQPDLSILKRPCPVAAQYEFCRKMAEAMGFDFSKGRIDVSAHPFTTGLGPGDTRITTRFEENNFSNAFFSTLHEAGHGLYDQGLPAALEMHGTPRASTVSLGIHESQSRLWENRVGRSHAFWVFFYPRLKKAFPGVFDDVSLEAFLFAVNHSAPSYIRTEADEVTYNLHICLRYEMETALIKGSLKTADVPGRWNELTQKFLGLTPPNDALGCLQDVHWSHGSFGYFPTYTLGNLYAAQFFEAVEYEMGRLEPLFEKGNFTVLKKWLNEKIHSQGQRYRAGELCRKITGHNLATKPFLDYLEKKFGALYGF
jgi:carboxypeptidase Taq